MKDELLNIISKFVGHNNVILVPTEFIRITGDINSALLLSQLLYWTSKSDDGWIYKTHKMWQDELCLSKFQIRGAIAKLKNIGILEVGTKTVNGKIVPTYKILKEETKNYIVNNLQGVTEEPEKEDVTPERKNDIESIFNYYLDTVSKINIYIKENNINKKNPLVRHKSINSKCTVSLSKDEDKIKTMPLTDILNEYLDQYSSDILKKALDNYFKICIDTLSGKNEYFYTTSFKNLGSFVYSGVHRNTGFKSVLDLKTLKKGYNANMSEIDILRKKFLPITTTYSLSNILDKNKNTYYGFMIDRLNNTSFINESIFSLKQGIKNFDDFCWAEEAIASILFTRKGGYDIVQLQALMSMWQDSKKTYKKQALMLLNN